MPMFEGARGVGPRRRRKNCWTWSAWATALNHLPQKLSVGERQRVAIARSLANDPIALLADEPTGNLDSVSAEGIFDLFAYLHREQRMTIVLITHDEEFGHAHSGRSACRTVTSSPTSSPSGGGFARPCRRSPCKRLYPADRSRRAFFLVDAQILGRRSVLWPAGVLLGRHSIT